MLFVRNSRVIVFTAILRKGMRYCSEKILPINYKGLKMRYLFTKPF